MTALPQQILALLTQTTGLTDRQITNQLLGTAAAQQPVNIAARGLEKKGHLIRKRREDGRIGNYLNPAQASVHEAPKTAPASSADTGTMAGMSDLSALVAKFVHAIGADSTDIHNEFSLQHEFGMFLRSALPTFKVQFERNVSYFAPAKTAFTKREIDIVVFSPDKTDLRYAIELKYPRNGQYPEQMFSFCKDIAFAEELKAAGFARAALLIFADDRLFFAGPSDKVIYSYFRAARPITGRIEKPTGDSNNHVQIEGSYVVSWHPVSSTTKYAFVEAGNAG